MWGEHAVTGTTLDFLSGSSLGSIVQAKHLALSPLEGQ